MEKERKNHEIRYFIIEPIYDIEHKDIKNVSPVL
jgi:hypothetical protein